MQTADKIDEVIEKYTRLSEELARVDLTREERKSIGETLSGLGAAYEIARAWLHARGEIERLERDSEDPELKVLAESELEGLRKREQALAEDFARAMIPVDPLDEANAIVEIRAGTGGEEAALFCADLTRMYFHYIAKRPGWKERVLEKTETERGGFGELIFSVEGKGAYGFLKFEAGTHRVQRVPDTESSGRIHTSAVTVAVLPDVRLGEGLSVDPKDLRIDTYRSSGAGGQHVNKTDSAVRITHIPSGITTKSQEERSQHRNKEIAMRMLRAKLYALDREQKAAKVNRERRSQVGTGDRSGRIRTYNYPQQRVTDHRSGMTLYRLQGVLEGDIQELVDGVKVWHTVEILDDDTSG